MEKCCTRVVNVYSALSWW